MNTRFLESSDIDIYALLSFSLFLISSDHITAPLILLVLLTIFTQLSFLGTGFVLALIVCLASVLIKNNRIKIFLRLLYILLSTSCIVGTVIGNPGMFNETPSLVSLILFSVTTILMIIKWGNKLRSRKRIIY